jgi:hypothetical protein
LEDSLRDRQGNELDTFVHPGYGHHVRYMAFHGSFAEVQGYGGLGGGSSRGNRLEDVEMAFGQVWQVTAAAVRSAALEDA